MTRRNRKTSWYGNILKCAWHCPERKCDIFCFSFSPILKSIVFLCIFAYSEAQHFAVLLSLVFCVVFFCFVCLRSVSCVPSVASVFGLSILYLFGSICITMINRITTGTKYQQNTFPLRSWSHGNWIYYLCNQFLTFTKVMSSNPVHGEVHSIQHYVIMFVSDLRQIGDFLRVPPPIKLTVMI